MLANWRSETAQVQLNLVRLTATGAEALANIDDLLLAAVNEAVVVAPCSTFNIKLTANFGAFCIALPVTISKRNPASSGACL